MRKVCFLSFLLSLMLIFISPTWSDSVIYRGSFPANKQPSHVMEFWKTTEDKMVQVGIIGWGSDFNNKEAVVLKKIGPGVLAGIGLREENSSIGNNQQRFVTLATGLDLPLLSGKLEGVIEGCFNFDGPGKTEFRNLAWIFPQDKPFQYGFGGHVQLGSPKFHIAGGMFKYTPRAHPDLSFYLRPGYVNAFGGGEGVFQLHFVVKQKF